MSDFEFMSRVSFGQYMPTASPFHRLDPRSRLIGGILLLSALTLSREPAGIAAGLGLILLGTALARLSLRRALLSLLPPLPFLLVLAMLQLLLGPTTPPIWWQWGPFHLSPTGLGNAGLFLLRFAALFLELGLFASCISATELVRGLEQLLRPLNRLGLPTHDLVLVVQVTLHFIPAIAQSAERIAKAQASRGADWSGHGGPLQRIRQTLPLLIPIFLVGMRRAETLALAMSARAYGFTEQRSSRITLHWQRNDTLALLVILAAAAAILWI